MFQLAVLIIASSINLLLGTVVYLKNPKSVTNRYFLMLTTSFAAWSTVNYISIHPIIISQLWWIRIVLFFAAYLCLMVFLTFSVFPHYELPPSKWLRKIAIGATGLVMVMVLSPLVFRGVKIVNSSAQPIPSFGIVLFFIVVISLLGGGVVSLIKEYRHSRARQRLQIKYVLLGLAGTFSLIVTTDFLLVVLFKNSKLVPLGPAYTLVFSGSLAYAIVKHRLFDIRTAAARALTYLLSLGFIGLVYGIFIFSISNIFTQNISTNATQRVFYIGFALLTALLFERVKKFFDRITNRIFFKDSYDPQELIDRLNGILVRTIQLDELLKKTRSLIQQTLKASEISFLLINSQKKESASFISNDKQFQNKLTKAIPLLDSVRTKLIVADELVDLGHSRLSGLLSETNIAVVVRLVTHQKHIGYLIVGLKQNGESYRSNDLQLLDIISDEMSLAIQNALRFEEIENFNTTLQQKVNRATQELRRANQRLKVLDETKDDFISMASHQLRTPLTSVKGYVSMVLDGDSGRITNQQRKLLGQAFTSSQRMVFLIADLLNVSRLKTGKFVIVRTPTNLADVVSDEVDQLTETAKSRHLTLTYEKPEHFPALSLDETKTRQVVMNFMDNAIYYTPSGGHVVAKLVDKPKSVEFMITDNGIGVPKAETHHLFSKFYRAGNAKKARPDGTGLGLFMAKKIIIAQGGAIIFQSQEGKGSTFGFTFPK